MRTHRTIRSRRTVTALGALTLGLAVSLTGCGAEDRDDRDDSRDKGDTSAQVSSTEHNAADVRFATDMIQHHAQALSMVDLPLDRPLDPEVQQLAEDIREAQGPEIETMTDWLTDWDEEIPETMRDHANAGHDGHDGHDGDHSMGDSMGDSMEGMEDDMDMPGTMTAEDMTALENASDAEFQDMWLQMMVEHHTGAVEMARTEQEDGQYEPAVDLARSIVASQTDEIEKMEGLLGS